MQEIKSSNLTPDSRPTAFTGEVPKFDDKRLSSSPECSSEINDINEQVSSPRKVLIQKTSSTPTSFHLDKFFSLTFSIGLRYSSDDLSTSLASRPSILGQTETSSHKLIAELQTLDGGNHLEANRFGVIRLLMKLQMTEKLFIPDIAFLTDLDMCILSSIVKRKYGININPKDFDDKKKLLAELNSLECQKKNEKRLEENYKLVFKRALKKLVRKYKKENNQVVIPGSSRKKYYETMACKQYFSMDEMPQDFMEQEKQAFEAKQEKKMLGKRKKQTTTKAGIPQSNESLPHELTYEDEALRKFVVNPTTVNSRFIHFLFKSPPFKDFFDDFVANHFIADYRKTRATKMLKIVDSLYSKLDMEGTNPPESHEQQIEELKSYIEKNAKFKLPWTETELRACISSTSSAILKLFLNKGKVSNTTKRDKHGRFVIH